MCYKMLKFYLAVFYVSSQFFVYTTGKELYDFSVYKVVCVDPDPVKILNISCWTKSKSRNVKLHYIHVVMRPNSSLTNIKVHVQYFVKYQTYQPILLRGVEDFCKFIKGKKKAPLISMLWPMLARTSNLNHTCPIDHDVLVDGLQFTDDFLPNVLPPGESRINIDVFDAKEHFIKVMFYVQIMAKGNNDFKG